MPRSTRLTHAVALAAGALGATALTLTGVASANHADHPGRPVPAPPAAPSRADQIQNIDQVKTAIKGYYGDTLDPQTVDPVTGAKDLHTFSPTGSYAREVAGITKDATRYLAHHRARDGRKAILLDVDDTSLNTYNYEIYSNFVYNPTTNAAFVNAASFPAVPTVPQLVNYATSHGYTVFFLTGRPEAQRAGTAINLTQQGYPSVPADQLYLKDLTKPIYASCYQPAQNKTCTTIQYKSLTRRYIESQGYDIVANLGDQYSDLSGGYSDRTFKLPNPMYYLP